MSRLRLGTAIVKIVGAKARRGAVFVVKRLYTIAGTRRRRWLTGVVQAIPPAIDRISRMGLGVAAIATEGRCRRLGLGAELLRRRLESGVTAVRNIPARRWFAPQPVILLLNSLLIVEPAVVALLWMLRLIRIAARLLGGVATEIAGPGRRCRLAVRIGGALCLPGIVVTALGPRPIRNRIAIPGLIRPRVAFVVPTAACARVVRFGHMVIFLRTNPAKERAISSAHFRNRLNTKQA